MDSVSICNLALNMLGIPHITSFDDTNNNAQMCKRFYPVVRDRVLRDHLWSFATTSTELQKLSGSACDPDFQYVCSLPGNLIRIVSLFPDVPFRKVGRTLLVDTFPVTLLYIQKVDDPTLFDETFTEALQYALAAEIASASTQDIQKVNFYRSEYTRVLALARSIDSQENCHAYQSPERRSSFLSARGRPISPRRNSGKINFVEGNAGKQINGNG
ncbi:MAG: hypothetical protein IJY46_07775 [Lentisphaeria bacterium]|nr:hypothetical protein [Lentisphaeria bacterium]